MLFDPWILLIKNNIGHFACQAVFQLNPTLLPLRINITLSRITRQGSVFPYFISPLHILEEGVFVVGGAGRSLVDIGHRSLYKSLIYTETK